MNPKEIIQSLIDIFSEDDVSRESILAGLESAGLSYNDAAQSYNLIQTAWGRYLLDGMGITFSDKYYCFDRDGELHDSGILEEQPIYAHAESIAESHKGSKLFEFMAVTSAEMNSVNAALNNGSKPENLITTPACMFIQDPTDRGVRKVQETLERELRGSAPVQNKPWWKFW